jgi:hypothetical protein
MDKFFTFTFCERDEKPLRRLPRRLFIRWRRSGGKEDVEVDNHEDEKGKEEEAIEWDEEEKEMGRL